VTGNSLFTLAPCFASAHPQETFWREETRNATTKKALFIGVRLRDVAGGTPDVYLGGHS
jgi:hypothetical protein